MKGRRYTFGRFLVDLLFLGLLTLYVLFVCDPVTYRKQEEDHQAFKDSVNYDSIEKARWKALERYVPYRPLIDTASNSSLTFKPCC